jgi:glycosyltransferase involved in cell wall biosynthesis
MRLGVFSDISYVAENDAISTQQAFVRFITNLPPRIDELVVFGRLAPGGGRASYVLPRDRVRFVPLPHYARITDVWKQLVVLKETLRTFDRELRQLDAVWVFGPHPLGVALALWARYRRTTLFLGVRQDYPRYIAGRLPSRRWAWAVGVAWLLDRVFRLLGRTAPTVAVGDELAQHYAGGSAPVLSTGFSLVAAADIADADAARPWNGTWRILSVGRIDPEKNPLLLAEIIHRLHRRDQRWRLTIAGTGPLQPELARRIDELDLNDVVRLAGYVAQGEALDALYREHHVFLHVSFTEGLPQVLFEAQAAAMPVVATAVGGVAAAVAGNQSAELIPPDDADAAVAVLERLAADPGLRDGLVARGLDNVRGQTMEAQLDRIAAFFSAEAASES